jgi:hypothetical protein
VSTCIRLFDGTDLDLANPNYGAVSARNIVHGLSGVYRFAGQSPRRLTVAEHTCMGARLLRIPEVAQTLAHRHSLKRLAGWALRDSDAACDALSRAFLIHDMPEFCLHGLTTALKRMPELAGYKKIERMHMEQEQLAERTGKLETFIPSETFKQLPHQEQNRMKRQLVAMREYLASLNERIDAATNH